MDWDENFGMSQFDDMEDDLEDMDEGSACPPKLASSKYKRKFDLLSERLAALDQDSEVLVYRIKQVNKLIQQGLSDRRLLMNELDKRGDKYKAVPVQLPFQETGGRKKDGNANGRRKRRGKAAADGKQEKKEGSRQPRRPQKPFSIFCKTQKESVLEELSRRKGRKPNKKELSEMLAHKWSLLETSEKEMYSQPKKSERAKSKPRQARRRKEKLLLGPRKMTG